MINQPEEDILMATPAFQNKILDLRRQINDKTEEVAFLNKEMVSLQFTVTQLVVQKKELESMVATLTAKKEKLDEIILDLEKQRDKTTKIVKDNEVEMKKHNEELAKKHNELTLMEKSLAGRIEVHNHKEIEVCKKEEEAKRKHAILDEKFKKLKELL